MLVLTRKPDEKIMIGDDIVITVIEVRSDAVRIGIEAPKDVKVHRAEVVDAVSEENRGAVQDSTGAEEALKRLIASSGGQLVVSVPADPQAAAG